MDMTQWIALGGFVFACFLAAATGGIFRPGAWYEGLRKPSWNPPNWLFAPAWTALYIMIAVSGWLVWREAGFSDAALPAFAAYGAQLLFNAAWSPLFFGIRRMDLALADAVAMWLSIALTIALFAPISAFAAWLLAPYLAWVTFATALNFTLLRMNPRAQPA